MWRYLVYLEYGGKWMFASYYLEAMTRPVSVCVWGGGGIRQAVSGPFLSRGAFCQPHSFSLPADTSLQEPPRIRLHQSVPIMPLINLFLSPTYPNIYRKNLCQINWFAPFFKFYKPPLCGGTPNLCFCISTTAEEPKSLKCTWNKTCIYFPLNISGCKTQTIQRPCELS